MRNHLDFYLGAAGLLLAGFVWSPAEAAPVFLSTFTQSSSTASLQLGGSSASNTVVAQETESSFTPTLSASSAYLAQIAGDPDFASAYSTASLTLSSASSGVAELTSGAALDLSTPGAIGAAHTGGNTGEPTNYVAYAFTDDRPFRATFTYNDRQSGSELAYFGPYTNTQGGGPLGPGAYPTNGTGSFSQTFGPGLWQFEFYDDIYSADVLAWGAPTSALSSTDYQLSFTIFDVPEPATWSLMLLGVAALGGRLRERRATNRLT